jgi:hypothetical protein
MDARIEFAPTVDGNQVNVSVTNANWLIDT